MLQARYPIVLGQQRPCHIVLPRTSPARGPPMLSRAVLGGHGMCAWAAGPAAGAPSPAELPHDGCARRCGEPRVEQLPGNRLLSRPTLRPLSPSQGPFFSLLLLPHWSQTLCAGEKLQPMPPVAPATGDLGTHGPRRGRDRRFWERWRGGGHSEEAQTGCGKSCWDTSLPGYSCPEGLSLVLSLSGNTGSICLEGGAQGSTQGQTSHS